MKVRQAVTALIVSGRTHGLAVQRGFTIIELLIVISIAAILATIAVPSFRDMLNTTRQNSALGLVINDLNQARGEAIKRNSHVLVCVRDVAGTDCLASTDWRLGWLVCGEGVTNHCAGSTLTNPNPLSVRPPLDASLTLAAVDALANPIGVIRFNADSTQGTGAVTMTLSGSATRTISIAGTGNISKQ